MSINFSHFSSKHFKPVIQYYEKILLKVIIMVLIYRKLVAIFSQVIKHAIDHLVLSWVFFGI